MSGAHATSTGRPPDRATSDKATSDRADRPALPRQATRFTAPDARTDLGRTTGPASTPRVTLFRSGAGWAYRIEGEPDLGHRFDDRAVAAAGGQYLARSLRGLLVIENADGSVEQTLDFGGS